MDKFLEEKPSLSEFDSCISHYNQLHSMVEGLPESYTIGAVLYDTTPLKAAIFTETQTWKQTYGKALAHRVFPNYLVLFWFRLKPL